MITTPANLIAQLIEGLTYKAKCPMYAQNEEKTFFSDSENNIFIKIQYNKTEFGLDDPMRISINMREGYDKINIVKDKYDLICKTIKLKYE